MVEVTLSAIQLNKSSNKQGVSFPESHANDRRPSALVSLTSGVYVGLPTTVVFCCCFFNFISIAIQFRPNSHCVKMIPLGSRPVMTKCPYAWNSMRVILTDNTSELCSNNVQGAVRIRHTSGFVLEAHFIAWSNTEEMFYTLFMITSFT